MRTRPLLALPLVALLAGPLLLAPAQAAEPGGPGGGAPSFRQYHAPDAPRDVRGRPTAGDRAGEPSLGVFPTTGNIAFMANQATFRVSDFGPRDEQATWTDITDPVEGAQTSDPILWTDPTTGRTFVNQLELQGGSLQAYTDDEGKTYTRSTMGGGIGISFDHQSVVTGIRTADQSVLPAPIGYPNYVYYCTNDLYAADCSVSIDGGLNFGAQVPVYAGELAGGPCTAIFGHLKTDPRDGTVYLPPNGCNGKQMLFASKDNTLSWTGYPVPGSTDGDSGHPSLDVGRQDGAVYYAWGSADGYKKITGRVQVATSPDQGKTWSKPVALGKDLGVVTSRFPVVVAGDKGRAAVAFLGATADGDPSQAPDPTAPDVKPYTGTWDLYVSYTLDGGVSWKTYDATPTDPIQRGPVCTRGTTCLAGRNLLDFNDMVVDPSGRVAIALADGALSPTDDFSKALSKATIVRQVGGPSLYAPARTRGPQAAGAATPQDGPGGLTPSAGGGPLAGLPVTGVPAGVVPAALGSVLAAMLLRRRRPAPVRVAR